jgi:alpha-tubulin suppressor-like RCC1 family protein
MRSSFIACSLAAVVALSLAACGGDSPPPAEVDGGPGTDLGGGGTDARVLCTLDVDCNDGLFCNGRETCAPASSAADARGCAPGDAPCSATETCDEAANDCRTTCEDVDGDGHEAIACGGDDCEDNDASRYPGATEICDGDDEDCNDATFGFIDADGDGVASSACCNGGTCGADCNDGNGDIRPGALDGPPDACNLIDDDCDGSVDEGCPCVSGSEAACYTGAPETRSVGRCADGVQLCVGGMLQTTCTGQRLPDAEICDGIDNDCDGLTDEDVLRTYYRDGDDDGFGLATETLQACSPPAGYVSSSNDCDDFNANLNPAAFDGCNGVDDDCDLVVDEGAPPRAFYRDADGDGFGATSTSLTQCDPPVGYVLDSTDCDDANGAIHPGGYERCDAPIAPATTSVDEDCDGSINEGCACMEGEVQDCGPDRPAVGVCVTGTQVCVAGVWANCAGAVLARAETCNGRDDDCDGSVDNGFLCAQGATRAGSGTYLMCASLPGLYTCDATCNAETFTASAPPESCDGADNNCNGVPDDGFACVQGSAGNGCTTACGTVGTYTCSATCTIPATGATACKAATETCNGCDDDRDGAIDDGLACVYGSSQACTTACGTAGTQRCLGDCSGYDACRAVTETCNACDDDLNGRLDDGLACVRSSAANPCTTACGTAGTFTCSATCTIPSSGAGSCAAAAEACNGCDDDRDGATDEGFLCVRGATRAGTGTFGTCTAAGSVPGFYTCSGDCTAEAFTATVPPETCDGADNNCNGVADDGFACVRGRTGIACVTGCGTVGTYTCAADCTPGACTAPEVCNGCDDDGVGGVDNGVQITCYADADDDGWAAVGATTGGFCTVAGRTAEGGCPVNWTNRNPATSADCDDSDATRNPGKTEPCNGIDDDCDGTVDDGASALCGATSAQTACLSGRCAVTACAMGFSDCDGSPANGCEVNTASSVTDCGACGVRCPIGSCSAGLCSPVNVVEISTSGQHACARLSTGQVMCWGRNNRGQLGDGTLVNSVYPVVVAGLADAVELATGGLHTCARRATGGVVCWGDNAFGQLGDGTITGHVAPAPVVGLSGVAGLAAAKEHTCAQLSTGAVVCWGRNLARQLGDGTTVDRYTPVAAIGIADAVELSAGADHTCARRATGGVACWGSNTSGQLGDGSVTDAIGITAGAGHTCVVRAAGTVACWGGNFYGQLGDGTTLNRPTPGTVTLPLAAAEVAAGATYTCARLTDRTVRCWGINVTGQLGNGTFTNSSSPVVVRGVSDASALAAGSPGLSSCVLRTTGGIRCWGQNNFGQLSTGTTADAPVAMTAHGFADPTAVASSFQHTCAVRATGVVECWGLNDNGQLGDGTTTNRPSPVVVSGLTNATQVSTGDQHTCVVRSDATVACWGRNSDGQLGDGTNVSHSTPAPVVGLAGVAEVAASEHMLNIGKGHTCARLYSGAVYCWGANEGGQLGNNSAVVSSSTPVPVSGLTDAVEIAVGLGASCARRANGAVVCWGGNSRAQLGNGTTTGSREPSAVLLDPADAVELTGAGGHFCVRRTGGAVACWGPNGYGELGNGTALTSPRAVAVIGLDDATNLTAGVNHTCARRSTNTAVCWGRNLEGQLGDGTTTPRWTPTPADDFGPVIALAGARYHTCALRSDRSIQCLGANVEGELGDGSFDPSLTPVTVVGF